MFHGTKIRNNELSHDFFIPPDLQFEASSPRVRSRPHDIMSDVSEDFPCSRVKLLCSYGGRILPRPSDGRLRYVGGETRIITVNRDISFSELMMKLMEVHGLTVSIKYQLPDEDLDALVSVCSDEDLENMMDEYDTRDGSSRIRVFLFSSVDYDADHFSDSSGDHRNSEQLYLDAINGVLDTASAKNSGSAVSDATQDFEHLMGIDLGDTWSASSMEDTLPAQITAQLSQSGVPLEQLIPVSSPLSVLDSLSANLLTTTAGDRKQNLPEQDQQADQFDVNAGHLITRDAQTMEEVLENWSISIALSNPTLQGANSGLSVQVPEAASPDLLKFSPKSEMHGTSSQMKLSTNSDPTSGSLWTFSRAPSKTERATSLEEELSQWQQEPSVGGNSSFPEQIVEKEKALEPQSQHIDLLLDSPLPNFHQLNHVSGIPASYHESQTLQQLESQLSKPKHPEVNRSSQEQVVIAAKQEFGYGEKIARQENLIDLDVQQEKQELDVLSIPGIPNVPYTRLEQPNYLDAEYHQTRDVPVSFSDRDIPLSAPSLTELGLGALSEQNIKSSLPANLDIHPQVSLPQLNIYGGQKPPVSMQVLSDSILTSATSGSNDNLLERFEGFSVQAVDESRSAEKQSSSDPRNSVGVQHDESQKSLQLSAELDKLGELLLGSASSATNENIGVAEEYLHEGQGPRLGHAIKDEIVEKTPGHPRVPFEPPTDIFFDLLTSPVNVPPQLLMASLTISSATTTSVLSKPNALQNQSPLVPEPNDANLLLIPTISLDKTVSKVNCHSPITDAKEVNEAVQKPTTVELQGSFSFSAGHQIKSATSDNVVVQNHNLEKDIHKLDPVEFEIPGETTLEEDYKSVHASLIEEALSNNSPITASAAELEAIARGLQIIRNSDLEERRELGSGTFGTVYHGKWRGSDVAIKRIKASCFAGSPSEQERLKADFWREACILAQLHHPNVVAFYGVVPDGPGGTLATVTEYMVNGSLKQVLRRNDRALDRRRRSIIAMDATFGMEYLHGKNIVHFDLKCDNLLVNMRDPHRPICKVGDLGLSKVKHQTLVSGGVRGTLPWMAPELLNGNSSKVCEKVDVFSFGIVMWELLTGEEPYADLHYGAIIGGIVNNTLRPTVPKWCDSAWKSLMERCWSADPLQRPSFAEIAYELRAMSTSQLTRAQGQNQV
ncbi:hypothetical protein O6H91_09G057100 [Diphasiastrum complanatum]|uniref:Uncharacterized protein n=5 Tax=Diphasiastrum complanatum TaxID=34168 RepID=A0ACC2CPL1_DIPCM|nr:hypothetical protein O6H91_09G057100 [Diphasiastrum complanatum]KAJ7543880.1 hypothetical protein O6H91_09G057100 [Diphasiastrum complanatum]KAJ7543881.1 hypothetical protein O6H91_09G057100 [Diphasiastrum complanatum]KAJ7543884.1 hypothetical protein O6H91_09G057100 [Diphasiastrum complanatum]KAJ7543885.1 hypothetical protein O6H91_09G057100 [Diphasiastrum complanatum]